MSRLDDLLREERRLMTALAEIGELIALDPEWRAGPPIPQPLRLVPPPTATLALSVRSPQDAPEPEDDAPAVPTSGLPVCTCPPCLAERASERRP